ncbi:Terpenoid cyclases/protein prenyltransferase alpha-alpha toroid [Sesbania bispinosa]|nr:Terpenoid cyclases/protein prenyltransferase alpha-alpha toroid [Sesbania bispinosa]
MLVPENEEVLHPLTKANLIDSIQRLGLYYHFEHEIGEVLQQIHNNYVENGIITLNEDLYSLALLFRLLRQQGYHISPDVFNKFKDDEGNFSKNLIANVEGMLSLYEATHLRIHGEDILDEALVFTSSNLKLISTQLSHSLSAKVNNCLKHPLHKNLPRLVARNYIFAYEKNPSHDEDLLLFAKLDFNKLQKQHQMEVGTISKWWKDLELATNLPFARDNIVEIYFWTLGVYFEPQYSLGRRLLTKMISIISLIDDIYDVYGTLEELQLFTKAIMRFEAEWFHNNYKPQMEQIMETRQLSSGYCLMTAIAFVGMGCIATENAFHWLTKGPKIIKALTKFCRLMDDIVSNEIDRKRGHGSLGIEWYMKQHSVTKQDAINELFKQVMGALKDINEECLDPTQMPKPLITVILNLSRVIDVVYKDEDTYIDSKGSAKDNITSLILNPCSI